MKRSLKSPQETPDTGTSKNPDPSSDNQISTDPGKPASSGRKPAEDDQKELLKEIGKKEKELEEMLQKARQEAEKKISAARMEAEEIIRQCKETISEDVDDFVQGGLVDVEREVKEIIRSAEKKSELIRKKAAARVEEIAGKVMEALFPSPEAH